LSLLFRFRSVKEGNPMTTDGFKRKLTAILSADVEGYSRLMGEDEDATIRTLTTYRELMASLIQKHRGRVVDSPGDNLLAEFGSVVDAVRCAVEIQEELRIRNAELPENRRMEFRIGINLGDVVEEGERIYGDGVNITARVEGLAEGGGICISGTVYDSIKNKLSLSYESLGEHAVKNITEPVRVYRMRIGPEAAAPDVRKERKARIKKWQWAALAFVIVVAGALAIWNFYFRPPPIEPASQDKMAFPLPDKPSIAVLPFVNMSEDPNQEYLADGITENIISALSQVPKLFVIARQSTFAYKNKPVKIQQVAEELGVRYVLEGSVQRSGDILRITAQLIDAIGGHHLLSERYDRELKDIFALQDEITLKICNALQMELTSGEQARLWHKGTKNLEAWGCIVKGNALFVRMAKGDNAKARDLYERAVKIDPMDAFAWTMLAWTHWIDAFLGYSESRAESFKRAVELAKKALSMDDTLSDVYALLGGISLFQRQYEKAIAAGEKSITLGPNSATSHVLFGYTMTYAGRFEEAIALIKKGMRLTPHYPAFYLNHLGRPYFQTGRYEEALATYKKLLECSRKGEFNPLSVHLNLAATYIMLGREEEARAHVAEVLRIIPNFSLEWVRKASFYKDPAHLEHHLSALRKAGLPE
jgi:adenylate cyclase